MSLRCSCSFACGEPFAPLRELPGSDVQLHVCACWRGSAAIARGWGCRVAGDEFSKSEGSGVDLRAVAGVRQKGECCGSAVTTTMMSFVRVLLLRFVLCLSAQSLSPCMSGGLCPRHEMYPPPWYCRSASAFVQRSCQCLMLRVSAGPCQTDSGWRARACLSHVIAGNRASVVGPDTCFRTVGVEHIQVESLSPPSSWVPGRCRWKWSSGSVGR